MSCTTGAPSAALVTKLIASITTALRNLILKLSLPFNTALSPHIVFLATALRHDRGL
jgi:hypothetical protein